MLERQVRQTGSGKLCNLREVIMGKTVIFLVYKFCPMFRGCSNANFEHVKKTCSDV